MPGIIPFQERLSRKVHLVQFKGFRLMKKEQILTAFLECIQT